MQSCRAVLGMAAKLNLQSAAFICEAAKTEAQQAILLQNVIGCRVQSGNVSCLDQTAPCSILMAKVATGQALRAQFQMS